MTRTFKTEYQPPDIPLWTCCPETLQYLMGHSDIGVTLNIYTHIGYDDI